MKIPILAVETLMREESGFRISNEAKKELIQILEEKLYKISIKASKISLHSKRKTITQADIKISII